MNINKKLPIILALFILVLFLATDLIYWGALDHFKTPLRHISGDTALYVYQLNSVIRGNGPVGNPYFWENKYELGRFYVFGKMLSILPLKDKIPIIWWTILLRGLVPLLVFLILSQIFQLFKVKKNLAYLFSFIFVLFYGPMTFKGGIAMANWFLPGFLLAVFLAMKFYPVTPKEPDSLGQAGIVDTKTSSPGETSSFGAGSNGVYQSEKIGFKSFLLSLLSLLLFSFHPVYFSIGVPFSGILWLIILRKGFSKRLLVYFLVWSGFALAIFSLVFLPFMYSTNANFLLAAKDMAFRNTSLATHFPVLFLFGVRFLILVLVSGYIFFRANLSREWKLSYLLIFLFSAIAFLGLNSYVITGKYFLNDHYPLVESFIAMPLALMLLFGPSLQPRRFFRFLGIGTLIFAGISIFVVLNASNFKPTYSGPWAPLFLSYLLLGLILFKPGLREIFVFRYKKFWILSLILLSVFYSIFINIWDEKHWLPLHKETQKYRDFIEKLSALPPGVILADPHISNLALVYTAHKVYWSPIAGHDLVSTKELYNRWIRTRVFFPEEPSLNDRNAIYSVYGARVNKCREFKRYIYLNILERIGIRGPKKAICDESIYETWPQVKIVADKFLSDIKSGKEWDPIYRVDYLVVEKEKDVLLPELVEKYFKKLADDGRFVIYSFKSASR